MKNYGFEFPDDPRRTALFDVEEWYQNLLAGRLNRSYEAIKRSNFGEYNMAVNCMKLLKEVILVNTIWQ
jgi:hypothetical protein